VSGRSSSLGKGEKKFIILAAMGRSRQKAEAEKSQKGNQEGSRICVRSNEAYSTRKYEWRRIGRKACCVREGWKENQGAVAVGGEIKHCRPRTALEKEKNEGTVYVKLNRLSG